MQLSYKVRRELRSMRVHRALTEAANPTRDSRPGDHNRESSRCLMHSYFDFRKHDKEATAIMENSNIGSPAYFITSPHDFPNVSADDLYVRVLDDLGFPLNYEALVPYPQYWVQEIEEFRLWTVYWERHLCQFAPAKQWYDTYLGSVEGSRGQN